MARSHLVDHARKSPGKCGKCGVLIHVREPYYWWKFRHGGKRIRCANHPPRQSELTASDKLSRAYAAQEAIEDVASDLQQTVAPVTAALTSNDAVEAPVPGVEALFQAIEEVKSILDEQANEANEIAQEYNDAADNIEQTFSSSPTADECREKAETLEEWAGTLEGVQIETEELWIPFAEFVRRGTEEGDLAKVPGIKGTTKAIVRAQESDATYEEWQKAFNLLRDLRRKLTETKAFDEAIDQTADFVDQIVNDAEAASGELSL